MYAPNKETFFLNLCQRYPYGTFDRNWVINEVARLRIVYGFGEYTELEYLNYCILNADLLVVREVAA
jgi:hypothetical protein